MASLEAVRSFLDNRTDYCGSCLGLECVATDIKLLMRFFSDEELPLFNQWLEAPDNDKPDFGSDFDARRRAYAAEFTNLVTPIVRELADAIAEMDAALEARRARDVH